MIETDGRNAAETPDSAGMGHANRRIQSRRRLAPPPLDRRRTFTGPLSLFLPRKDIPIPLKINILTSPQRLIQPASFLLRLIDALRSVIQSPSDPFSLKDQFLISSTTVFITSLSDNDASSIGSPLRGLVELLLTRINRPNHGLDRQKRGVSCECLRQLGSLSPVYFLKSLPICGMYARAIERTHVSQLCILLLSTLNIVTLISNAVVPFILFNLPQFLIDGVGADFVWKEKENY